jgi:hypothetical protein
VPTVCSLDTGSVPDDPHSGLAYVLAASSKLVEFPQVFSEIGDYNFAYTELTLANTVFPPRFRSASESSSRPLIWAFRDTVFCSQIFVPHQQLLIHSAGDIGQHASPNHLFLLVVVS